MRLMSTMTAGLRMRRFSIGHQALTTGQHPAVLPGVAQDFQGLVQAARRVVVEPSRLHVLLNPHFDVSPN